MYFVSLPKVVECYSYVLSTTSVDDKDTTQRFTVDMIVEEDIDFINFCRRIFLRKELLLSAKAVKVRLNVDLKNLSLSTQ